MIIPNMVDAAHKEFGLGLSLEHLTAFGSEPLGAVLGVRPEGGIVHVHKALVSKCGGLVKSAFHDEVIEVPQQLLLVTDAHGHDITAKFLTLALKMCDKVDIPVRGDIS